MKKYFLFLISSGCFVTFSNFSPIAYLLMGFATSYFISNSIKGKLPVFISSTLKIAIIGLGLKLSWTDLHQVQSSHLYFVLFGLCFTLISGWILLKFFNLEKQLGLLLTVGTAICGGSAIATVASVTKAKGEHVAAALCPIYLLNASALVLFPLLAHFFNLTDQQFGVWAAIAIHDTSSVLGATSAFSDSSLNLGLMLKLIRSLAIIPVSLGLLFTLSKKGTFKVPIFLLGFIAAIIISNIFSSIDFSVFVGISKKLLFMAIFFIGMSMSVNKLQSIGIKPILFSGLLWIAVSFSSLGLIMIFI
ncbi:putative sulfate exporter family transporter [bacterium]|jgi:uncharacterized integral membrane protein (TIGR00698 family)|nr:putative sulfate exporter family transporter [bacterium]